VDGGVERAGERLHPGCGLDGLPVEGHGDALVVGVDRYVLGGDGSSVYDHVLKDVAGGVVDRALDPPDLGSRGVVDGITFHRHVRVVGAVVPFFDHPTSGSVGGLMCV
jgi:hypothetical protein